MSGILETKTEEDEDENLRFSKNLLLKKSNSSQEKLKLSTKKSRNSEENNDNQVNSHPHILSLPRKITEETIEEYLQRSQYSPLRSMSKSKKSNIKGSVEFIENSFDEENLQGNKNFERSESNLSQNNNGDLNENINFSKKKNSMAIDSNAESIEFIKKDFYEEEEFEKKNPSIDEKFYNSLSNYLQYFDEDLEVGLPIFKVLGTFKQTSMFIVKQLMNG